MELTNELKARFFALYFGQEIAEEYTLNRLFKIGKHMNLEDINSINLRPLSSIKEEEAKECGLSGLDQEERKEALALFDAMPLLNHKENIITIFENIEPIEGGLVKYIIANIDYLRSKGFALPFMGISVDEMVKAGWIKLRE
jgi:hypothetical protein